MDHVDTERLLSALERIAMALEIQTGLARPEEGIQRDDSAALYTDDFSQWAEEQKREARRSRGAVMPPETEPLPEHGTKFFPREDEFVSPLADATGEP
jgi:hypothetical protein